VRRDRGPVGLDFPAAGYRVVDLREVLTNRDNLECLRVVLAVDLPVDDVLWLSSGESGALVPCR